MEATAGRPKDEFGIAVSEEEGWREVRLLLGLFLSLPRRSDGVNLRESRMEDVDLEFGVKKMGGMRGRCRGLDVIPRKGVERGEREEEGDEVAPVDVGPTRKMSEPIDRPRFQLV